MHTNFKASGFCFFLFILLIPFIKVYSQAEIDVKIKSLKAGRVGLTEAIDNIQEGDKWAKKGDGYIQKALNFYLLAADYNLDCPELNYKIGLCYLRSDHKEKALDYLKAAYAKRKDITTNMLFVLGDAYQYKMEFNNAIRINLMHFISH